MTKDEALKLALEALEKKAGSWGVGQEMLNKAAIAAIKEALEQSVQQVQKDELAGVAYVDDLDLWHFYPLRETVNFPAGTKFYTTPQQRQWVGLTDEEASWCQASSTIQTWKRIEAKLKEKNT